MLKDHVRPEGVAQTGATASTPERDVSMVTNMHRKPLILCSDGRLDKAAEAAGVEVG